jgi:predicted transcriptional regulator of viral defense system
MKIDELAGVVGPGGLFTTGFLLSGGVSAPDLRRQLDRWVAAGKVLRLRRGLYQLNRPYASEAAHPFRVANTLSRGSCVSLQSALSYWGMIPEDAPVTTSVTTGRPERVDNPLGSFLFRHIKETLFWGFAEIEISRNQMALIAGPAKALIDLLYLTPGSDEPGYLQELRIAAPGGVEESEFVESLRRTSERVGSPKIRRAVDQLVAIHRWEDA